MKFLLCAALLCLCVAYAKPYTYTPPKLHCNWMMVKDYENHYTHYKEEYRVMGRYSKEVMWNHVGQLVKVMVTRPDLLTTGLFMYTGTSCGVQEGDLDYSNYADIYELEDGTKETFLYFDDAVYNGVKCVMYYNNNASGLPDKGKYAIYVDYDGRIIGKVKDLHDWEKREVTNYTYYSSTLVSLSDFTLPNRPVYRCPDVRIFNTPAELYTRCAASTTTSVFAVIVATILAALVLVF